MEAKSNPGIEILLRKFLEGKSSSGDKQKLYDFLGESENEKPFKEILITSLAEFNEDQFNNNDIDFTRIYGNILHELKQKEILEFELVRSERKATLKRILIYCSSIAAIFIIAFFLGRHVPLSDKTISDPLIRINFNEINTPFGSKSVIKLPDGTEVMLNAGSTLKYSSDFNVINRNLVLIGEAYFKVAKDIDLPLYVTAGNISIKSIGTEFNVKAYDEEGIIETTLIEGKIEITHSGQNKDDIQYIDLNPNQKAIYIKDRNSFTLVKAPGNDSSVVKPSETIDENILPSTGVDVNQVVAWTHGKLIIRGENLDNLCVELQRKYDVNFIFKNEEIKMYRFSGVLLDETLEQVLNVIKLTAPIEYSLEGKTVFMSSDKERVNDYLNHLK